MSEAIPMEEDLLRRALFVPCFSKQDLHQWICVYLGLNFPDTIVDPESNTTPMDLIWEVYSKAMENTDESFSRVMSYAARDSFKTLGAAVLEVLMVLHLDRDVAHMAAIKEQAKKAQSYVKKFFRFPYLRDYVVSANTEKTELCWYHDPVTGEIYTRDQLEELPTAIASRLEEHLKYIKIVICTMQGANCIDPASLVTMGDGTLKAAVDVVPEETVRSFDLIQRKFVEVPVKEVGFKRKKRMRVSFDDGGAVVVSEDHPILTQQGWRYARALKLGQACFAGSELPGTRHESFEVDLEHSRKVDPWRVLLGTLLGDASLTWPRGKNGKRYGKGPRFQMSHSLAQRAYFERKLEYLKPLIGECQVYPGRGQLKAMSKVLPELSALYERLYPNGKKSVSVELLGELGLEGLTFWLMDDGAGGPQKVGSAKDKRLSLATCCFDRDQNQVIVEWLSRLGSVATVGSVSNGRKRYPVIEWDLDESRKLSATLDRFILPDMKYKFPAPAGALAGRCIDCGARTPPPENGGFSRCAEHPFPSTDRAARASLREFKRNFTKKISKLEFLDAANLIDIHLDGPEQVQNFTVNQSYQVHNSEHVPFFVVDEVDVVPKQNQAAYQEAKSIPAMHKGKEPITLLTSTRKFAFGNVQRELDTADRTHLVVRHWNIIDVTERSIDQDTILVLCDGTSKSIKDVRPGDRILGVSDEGEVIETDIFALFDHGMVDGIEVTFSDGYRIVASENHKFLTSEGQVQLKDILIRGLEVLCVGSEKARRVADSMWSSLPDQTGNDRPRAPEVRGVQGDLHEACCRGAKEVPGGESATVQGNLSCRQGRCETLEGGESRGALNQSPRRHQSSEEVAVGEPRPRSCGYSASDGGVGSVEAGEPGEGRGLHQKGAARGKESFKDGGVASGERHLDLGHGSDPMWGAEEAGRLRVSGPSRMGGGGWVLPLFCSEECAKGYGSCACEGSGEGRHAEHGGEGAGSHFDPPFYGRVRISDGSYEGAMAGMAYSDAPLSSTGSLVRRRIVSAVPVGQRRMYDLGVAHHKHNFLLPNGVVTSNCPTTRHLPDRPRIPIWTRREDFSSISQKQYEALPPEKQGSYTLDQGYEGCLSKCELFTMCRGHLATRQKEHPRKANGEYSEDPPPLLKSIRFTTNKFRELTLDMAKAQLMCWQASQEGLIFPLLDKQKHYLTPVQVAKKLTGEDWPTTFGYEGLLQLLGQRDGRWVAGIDHGYTHVFSVVLLYVDGNRAFVMGRWSESELDPAEKIDLLERTIRPFNPSIYPDTEQPDMNKFLKKHGFRVKEWVKGPGSVLSGIETVRYKLTPGISADPQLFFVEGAPGVVELMEAVRLYHWTLDDRGKPTDVPDDVIYQTEGGERILDDEVDALRYAVMNTFKNRGAVSASKEDAEMHLKVPTVTAMKERQTTQAQEQRIWAQQIMEHALGFDVADQDAAQPDETLQKKGGFFWGL